MKKRAYLCGVLDNYNTTYPKQYIAQIMETFLATLVTVLLILLIL